MNRIAISIFLWALMIPSMHGQNEPPTIYAESFRQGSLQITEEAFEARLSPQDATYRERIKDFRGEDRYELTVTPYIPEGDNKVTTWLVKLRDLRHRIYNNVLVADQEPSSEAKDNLWRLDPNRFGPVPIRAKRIVKVDSFYVTMQVKALHFTPLDSPYLDSMVVQFAFTNSDPRAKQ
jgi:hypothetical protein